MKMTTPMRGRRRIAATCLLFFLSPSPSIVANASDQGVSQHVKNMCTPDAQRLCPEHPLGTEKMRYCMEAKFSNISRDCVKALEDEGLVASGTHKQHANRR